MRRKLVLTVVAVVATLLALSPLAWAADTPSSHPSRHHDDQYGLVNVGDVLTNVCPDVGLTAGGILGILGHRADDGDVTTCTVDRND